MRFRKLFFVVAEIAPQQVCRAGGAIPKSRLAVPHLLGRGSEFGIRGSEFGIRGSGFGIRGSGFGVRDEGVRDEGVRDEGVRDSEFGVRDEGGCGYYDLILQ